MIQHARTALAALLMAITVTATACAMPPDEELDTPTPPANAGAAQALLTSSDVPGFTQDRSEDVDLQSDTGIGCLTSPLDSITPIDRAETTFTHGDGFPAIFQAVETYRDEVEVARVMSAMRQGVGDCDQDAESLFGLALSLDVVDSRVTAAAIGLDDMIGLEARSSAGGGAVSFDVGLSLAVASVGRRLTIIGAVDLGESPTELLAPYAGLAAQRLVATSGR